MAASSSKAKLQVTADVDVNAIAPGGEKRLMLISPELDRRIIKFVTPKRERKPLRLCNKYLRDMVDDLVTKCSLKVESAVEGIAECISRGYKLTAIEVRDYDDDAFLGGGEMEGESEDAFASLQALFEAHQQFEYLEKLKLLDVWSKHRLTALEQAVFPRLHELELDFRNDGFESATVVEGTVVFMQQLATAPFVKNLRILNISHHPVVPKELLAACTRLESLHYGVHNLNSPVDADEPQWRCSLIDVGALEHLKELDMKWCWFDDDVEDAILLGDAGFGGLTKLCFLRCIFPVDHFATQNGFTPWQGTKWVQQLKELTFWDSMPVGGMQQLALCYFRDLEKLWIVQDERSAQGMDLRPIVQNAHNFPSLQYLKVNELLFRTDREFLAGLHRLRSLRHVVMDESCYLMYLVGDFPNLEYLSIDMSDNWGDNEESLRHALPWIQMQEGKMPSLQCLKLHCFTPSAEKFEMDAVKVLRGEVSFEDVSFT